MDPQTATNNPQRMSLKMTQGVSVCVWHKVQGALMGAERATPLPFRKSLSNWRGLPVGPRALSLLHLLQTLP